MSLPGTREIGAIVAGGHFQGLGILRSLACKGIPVYVIDHDLSISRFSKYPKTYLRCPDVRRDADFLAFLQNLAERRGLRGWMIYANDDETVRFLAKNRDRLNEHFRVLTPPWEIAKFACEKRLTYELAARCGIPVPTTHYVRSREELDGLEVAFPAIIKPSVKEPFYRLTKRKAIRVDNRAQLERTFLWAANLVGDSDLMIQELIPGGAANLYSVGSLFREGRFLGRVVAHRSRQHPMDFGHATTFAVTVDIPELEEITTRILSAMGYYGLSEVEFMFDPRDQRYKLIEINARLWGWHTLAIGAGVDLPYLQYADTLGESIVANDFDKNVKWVRLVTDIPTALGEVFKGRMKAKEYLQSMRGKKEFSVMSSADPLPFLAELLMLPYLKIKRGF